MLNTSLQISSLYANHKHTGLLKIIGNQPILHAKISPMEIVFGLEALIKGFVKTQFRVRPKFLQISLPIYVVEQLNHIGHNTRPLYIEKGTNKWHYPKYIS